jgi:hypothetical protein
MRCGQLDFVLGDLLSRMFKLCRAVVGGLNSTLEQSQESGRSKFPEMKVGEARNDSDHE